MNLTAALAAIAAWLAVCLVSIRRPETAPWPPPIGSAFTALWAWGVTILLYFGIVRMGLPHLPQGVGTAPLRWTIGGGLSIAGSVLQGAAVAQLGFRRTSGWNTARPETSRLYARMRHPQYAGQALFFAGWAVLTLDPLTTALCTAAGALLVAVGWTEDHVHRSRDAAAWARYQDSVPGWLPKREPSQ